jgi:hypothetical protein
MIFTRAAWAKYYSRILLEGIYIREDCRDEILKRYWGTTSFMQYFESKTNTYEGFIGERNSRRLYVMFVFLLH